MKYLFFTLLFILFQSVVWTQEIDPDYKKMIERKYNFPTVSQNQAEKKLHSKVVFLDARQPEEYKVSHLPNAYLFQYKSPVWEVLDAIAKDREIIVYCSIGVRSQKMAKAIKEKGYTNVKNLYGGIFLWADQYRYLVNEKNKSTQKVHGYNKLWGRWVKNATPVYE